MREETINECPGTQINDKIIDTNNIGQEEKVSIIIPALNEAECISKVLTDISNLKGSNDCSQFFEVIVVNNGSTDNTKEIAKQHGVIVVDEPRRGYGQACWTGINVSHGNILLFLDADGSADINDANYLIDAIRSGADLAIGTRNNPEPGAMSAPQKFGNALACALIRLIWKAPVTDLGPFRAIKKSVFYNLKMQDRGFGWTIEMQIKANRHKAVIRETPVSWRIRDAGQSKISGTVNGVLKAGTGILSMIFKLWWQDRTLNRSPPTNEKVGTSTIHFSPPVATVEHQFYRPITHSKEIKQ